MRTTLLVSLLALCTSGCLAVFAGAGLGYVVSQEVLPNQVHEAQVADDVDAVWPNVQETVEILHDVKTEIVVTEFPRRLQATIDRSEVTVDVEAHDIDRTLIRVSAKGTFGADKATAEKTMNRILARLSARS